MNSIFRQGFILFGFLVVGCASRTPQTDHFLSSPSSIPSSVMIDGVPFIDQKVGHCGPATLAMAMQWAGRPISVDQIAAQVYTPGAKGTFQLDMISATRRQGMLAIPVEGIKALTTEIAAKNPVIVFENLSVSWLPQWHYAIVFGYDIPHQIMTMHSGPENSKKWDMRKFERSWKLADYWGFVVLPPGRIAASADEFTHVKAAAGLEQTGKTEEARVSYQAIVSKWPDSLGASIGLGNTLFAQKKFSDATKILKIASERHPKNSTVWHNLAIAQSAARQKQLAKKSATEAMRLATVNEVPIYQESLKEILQ